jgi:hypothetical protein
MKLCTRTQWYSNIQKATSCSPFSHRHCWRNYKAC